MTSTRCPICSGADEDAAGALLTAIRALEDAAAGVRWRMTRGDSHRLDEQLVRLEQDIAALHALLRHRAGAVAPSAPARQRRAKPARTTQPAAASVPSRRTSRRTSRTADVA